MSQRVMPMLIANLDAPTEARTLHLVPRGADRCAVCGQHKLQMRFHYTDEPEVFALMAAAHGPGEPVGMWSPSDEMVKPYNICGNEVPSGNLH